MWLFTTLGSFSVVEHRDERDTLLVRARDRDELKRLIDGYALATRIVETPSADYPFRIAVPKDVFATQVLPLLAMDINYENFKDACAERHGDPAYSHGLLMTIWSAARKHYFERWRGEPADPEER